MSIAFGFAGVNSGGGEQKKMLRVELADEPDTFDNQVRIPGLRAIAEMVGKAPAVPRRGGKPFVKIATRERDIPSDRFPPYWREALGDLLLSYNRICAYSCFRIHPVTGGATVDHMAAKSRSWQKVYEWENYRLACSLLNAGKREFSDVLDPCQIQNGWFEMELVGFQLKPSDSLSVDKAKLVQQTIDRLDLNSFSKERASDAENYWSGDISLNTLRKESPFVAFELDRQNRLLRRDGGTYVPAR